MTQRVLWGIARTSWLISYGILALIWLVRGEWLWAVLAAALGILSLVTSFGRWAWVASVNFLMLLAASGVGAALSRWAALGSVLCGLIAWDVELFVKRLELFTDVPLAIMRAHLVRLGAIVLLSGILGAIALRFTVSVSFSVAWLLAFGFLVTFVLLLRQGLRR